MKLNPLLLAIFAGWVARNSGASDVNALQPFNTRNDTAPILPVPSPVAKNNITAESSPVVLNGTTDTDYMQKMTDKLIQQVKNGAPIFSVTIKLPMPENANEKIIMAQVKNVLNHKHKKKSGRGLRGAEDEIDLSISDILERSHAFVANATSTADSISISLPGLSEEDATAIIQLAEAIKNGTTVSRAVNLINLEDTMESDLEIGRRDLSAATASELYRKHPNVDFSDGVAGGTSWLKEIGIVGSNFLYGQLDTGIHQKHVDTEDMQINVYKCTEGVACTYTQISANVPLAQRSDNEDSKGHGSHVYGDAARAAPGMILVDDFRILDATGRGRYEMFESGIYACLARLKQLQSAADVAGVKLKKYILNASVGFMDFGAIPGIISEEQAKINSASIARIISKIEKMHKEYPWFQMVAAAGNSGNTNAEMPGSISSVIAVASHNQRFERSPSTNTHPNVVAVSAIGVDVISTGNVGISSTKLMSGTSMSSPLVAASLGLLWELFPNLKNTELKQLIKELSVDPSEYNWSDTFPIKNRIFNIDINQCIKLATLAGSNKNHKYFVEPELLKKMQDKASTYALDNIPVGGEPVFTLPNSSPVPLPVNGVASFTIDLVTSKPGTLRVAFSNKRVTLWEEYWESYLVQGIASGSLLAKPLDIPVNANTRKITISITRGAARGSTVGGATATYVVKDQDNNILKTITDAPIAGLGDISNFMIAMSRSSKNIVVKSSVGKPGSALNTKPPTSAPVIFTPSPSITKSTNTPTKVTGVPIVMNLRENESSLVKLFPNNNIIEIMFGNKKLLFQDKNIFLFEKNKKGKFLAKGTLPGTAPELKPGQEIILKLSRSSTDGKLVLEQQVSSKNGRTNKIKITYKPVCEVQLDGVQPISFAQVDIIKSKILQSQSKITKGL